jgi:site-specific DNA-methyltransferase (adenine-specific)
MQPFYQDKHITIYHADARDAAEEIPDVGMLLTDPSYGANFTSNRVPGRKLKPTANDGIRQSVRLYRKLAPLIRAEHVLWFTNYKAYPDVYDILGERFRIRGCFTWDKGNPGLGDKKHPGTGCDWVISAGEGSLAVRRQGSVIYDHKPVPPTRRRHVHEKPVSLGVHFLTMFGITSMADLFIGSGNFLVGAKELGIMGYGADVDERSCETAARALESTEAGVLGSFRYPKRGTIEPRRVAPETPRSEGCE